MDWRVRDFIKTGHFRAASNSLDARNAEIGNELERLSEIAEISGLLARHLNLLKCMTSELLTATKESLDTLLLESQLGVEIQKHKPKLDYVSDLKDAYRYTQHLSEDDPELQIIRVLIEAHDIVREIEQKDENPAFFKNPINVRKYKNQISTLCKSCQKDSNGLKEWSERLAEHLIFVSEGKKRRFKDLYTSVLSTLFRSLELQSQNLHGLLIMIEKDAHGDWVGGEREKFSRMVLARAIRHQKSLAANLKSKDVVMVAYLGNRNRTLYPETFNHGKKRKEPLRT